MKHKTDVMAFIVKTTDKQRMEWKQTERLPIPESLNLDTAEEYILRYRLKQIEDAKAKVIAP